MRRAERKASRLRTLAVYVNALRCPHDCAACDFYDMHSRIDRYGSSNYATALHKAQHILNCGVLSPTSACRQAASS